jgi:class 3 adenylate cyclase/pimeloyl-ACP methyl ester carboxylesterase
VADIRYTRTRDGVDIAYALVGDGSVDLVWIPAQLSHLEFVLNGPFRRYVGRFLAALGSFARVLAFDLRGSGLSARTTAPASPESWLEDLRAALQAAGMDEPAILGHGVTGCSLAVLHAATHPDRTRGLVLFGPGARTAWREDHPWGVTDAELERGQREILDGWGTERYVRGAFAGWWGSATDDPAFVEMEASFERHAAAPTEAARFNRIWHDIDIRSVLPTVDLPTLVIVREGWAAKAHETPLLGTGDRYRYVADRIPGARVVSVPGSEFRPWLGDTSSIVAATQEFLTGTTPVAEASRFLATVLFTDIVGSTPVAAKLGDLRWKGLLEEHDGRIRALLDRFDGKEVDTAGDGFLATFDGPARAVRCAQAIVDAVRPLGVEVRAGIHTGECETIDGKAGGVAVVIGARVCALAAASEVLVSQTVKDLVSGSGLVFEDAGEYELKGVPDRWRLYRTAG